ncbi:hypothetical protein [Reichenbachiella ulvae]|uniref:Uncharacterized protein n=1 Tax=Reichenbachiella ulvae TaxID=2980104 RepID=A0ABT3CTY9_9BACT|nr:hypothetical protein [Reichenbachiella ulvae]MCV9387138.1 hypothetical protein [Reichenbachiella ulvae]
MDYYSLVRASPHIYPQAIFLNQEFAHQISNEIVLTGSEKLKMRMEGGAEETDCLSQTTISATGLLVSQRLLKVLSNYKLMEKQIIPVESDSKTPYYWLSFLGSIEEVDWLNYSQSSFYYRQFGVRKGWFTCGSSEELIQFKKNVVGNMGSVHVEEKILTSDFNLDMFFIPYLDSAIYVSNKLKNALEENGISGLAFKEAAFRVEG